jgi:hypothetical protein
MEDIIKAAQSDPSVESDIDRVTEMLKSTNEEELKNNIVNSNQVIMDYLGDEKGKKIQLLLQLLNQLKIKNLELNLRP